MAVVATRAAIDDVLTDIAAAYAQVESARSLMAGAPELQDAELETLLRRLDAATLSALTSARAIASALPIDVEATGELTYNGSTPLDAAAFNVGSSASVQLSIDPGSRTISGVVWKINGVVVRDDDITAPFTLRYSNASITFGTTFFGEGPGNTGTSFNLGNGNHTFTAEVSFTDTSTLVVSATVVVTTVVIPPYEGGRGLQPDGSVVPPGVPAYSTTRTVAVSGALNGSGYPTSLNNAISAASGGDVIEVTDASGWNGVTDVWITGTPANSSPTNRVLIRPPVGQRFSANTINILGRNLCVAGFTTSCKIGQNNTSGQTLGDGSGFWRCGKSLSGFYAYGVTDGFFYECFSRDTKNNSTSDVAQAKQDIVRLVFSNCWFNWVLPIPGTESENHTDGIQFVGLGADSHRDVIVQHSVIHGASNAAIQGRKLRGTFTIDNCELGWVFNSGSTPGRVTNLQGDDNGNAILVVKDSVINGPLLAAIDPDPWASYDVTGNVCRSRFSFNGVYVDPPGNTWNTGIDYVSSFAPFDPSWVECPFT